ncbi:MAG: hypothetical protein KatS3mg103_0655 [Phycisphaerales bacterium]|nr:MAG: hypothetical protein KatS3mg103_0655 [Phycisphaerales bacterium]
MVYLCSAMLPWLAYSETVSRGSQAVLTNAQYLRKLPIPESAFVAQAMVSSAISLAISYALLAVAAVALWLRAQRVLVAGAGGLRAVAGAGLRGWRRSVRRSCRSSRTLPS